MAKGNKVFFKIIGLIICSLCGITNIISLFIISKKINSKVLKVISWVMLTGVFFSVIVFLTFDSSSFIFSLAILCACISALTPTFLSLLNIFNYKVAHDIDETVKMRNIIPKALTYSDSQQIDNITWVRLKEIKIAKQMYGDKGIAVLIEIDNQIRAEKTNEEMERLFKIEEEKKQEAENTKKEREQCESKMTEIEEETDEAEARILQMKKEDTTPKEHEEENDEKIEVIVEKPKKTDKYVFISYSTKDSDIAMKTKEILENSGINCWIAPWSIAGGSDYASEIPKALNGCSAMVLLLSKASQESKWVPKEVGIAIENSKIIIPFQIDNEIISDTFNFYLTNSQRISAFNRMNDAYDELTKSIYRLLQIN